MLITRATLRNLALLGCCFVVGLVFTPAPASAQAIASSLDDITKFYQQAAAGWGTALQAAALHLFYALALLELMWIGIKLILKNADWGEFVAEVGQFILMTGLFLAFIENSSGWATDVINSFRQAGGLAAGTQDITPASVFAAGYEVAKTMIQNSDDWNVGRDLEFIIAGLVIIIAFALIVAFMIVALVESYVVIGAGVLFLGFGGSRWTKEIALKVLMYLVAIGAKLFVMELLVGIGLQIVNGMATKAQPDLADMLSAVGVSVVLIALVKILPDVVQGMITGASFSSGGALIGAAAAVGGGVGGLAAGGMMMAAGAGAAGVAGAKTALSSLGSSASVGARVSAAAKGAAVGATRDFAGLAGKDLGRRLSGRPGSGHGTMGGRIAGEALSGLGRQAAPVGPSAQREAPTATVSEAED